MHPPLPLPARPASPLAQFSRFSIPSGTSALPPRYLASPSYSDTCLLSLLENLSQAASDSQLLLEALAHGPLSSLKSSGLCRECNQQLLPPHPSASLMIAVCRQYLCCLISSAGTEWMLKYLPTNGEICTNTKDNGNWIRHPRIACGAKGRLDLLLCLGEAI